MDGKVTRQLANFVAKTNFEDLPHEVVHETKRLLLDILGCAVGSPGLDKGRIAVDFATGAGGPSEATILGTRRKVAAGNAAFANGELMHALDYCPLMPPNHITAFVTPAPLAVAEARGASGRALILAVALAHEVASRVGLSLDSMRAKQGGHVAPTWGLGFDQFGAAAGAAKILDLDASAMTDALGLAGYFAPVPSHNKYLLTPEGGGLAKYGPAGWVAQGGVTTAVLASMGYQGDRSILDGEFGFWAMAGSDTRDLEKITAGLGERWNLLRVTYKRWPCCGVFQSPLGAFTRLVAENDLKADEIEHVLAKNEPHGGLPRFAYPEIRHHVDAQSNLPYNLALVAHRVPVSADWQSAKHIDNPRIRVFMNKVSVEPYARAEETRQQELDIEKRSYIERRPSSVKVRARRQDFIETVEYASWLSLENPDYRATDQDLMEKFRANVSETLDPRSTDLALQKILTLDDLENVGELTASLAARA